MLLVACCIACTGCDRRKKTSTQSDTPQQPEVGSVRNTDQRNEKWAVKVELEGCPNMHKVTENLYRGAQPEDEGFQSLKEYGIKTVINLRNFHSDRSELKGTGIEYAPIKMNTWEPTQEDVIEFLKTVTDKSKQPVYVHCMHGADRTGMMCAIYRIVIEGWEKDDAIKEMVEGGYNYHSMWTGLPKFIRQLDVDEIKKELEQL